MQITAGLQDSTGEIIYSRVQLDLVHTKDDKDFIDGGQTEYVRKTVTLRDITIDLPVSLGELYEDWNQFKNKYGRILPINKINGYYIYDDSVKFVKPEDILDRNSFEFKKQTALWGTNGPKGDKPTKCINLIDAETDHLKAILKNCSHISEEYRKIINSILEDRKTSL